MPRLETTPNSDWTSKATFENSVENRAQNSVEDHAIENRVECPVTNLSGSAPSRQREPLLFLLVLGTAAVVFSIHSFLLGLPNSSLLFDASAYLATANGCLQACTFKNAAALASYMVQGFPDAQRAVLAGSLSDARDLIKHGPLMPVLLAAAYALCHAPALPSHWQIGAATMVACQSLTVALMWLIANRWGGRLLGIVACALALLNPGMLVNAARVFCEIPGSTVLMFAIWVLLRTVQPSAKNESRSLALPGALLGMAWAGVVVARPVFLFLPLIIFGVITAIEYKNKRRRLCSPALLSAALAGALIVLAPWALCKQIFTGQPSIMIDRHGAYNLYAGMHLADDGFDVLPSPYVAHPEQYTPTMQQTIGAIASEATQHPVAFFSLLARKPARLLDSPWNDFQTPTWGIGSQYQIWWHEFLLLCAVYGFAHSVVNAIKRRSYSSLIPPLVLGSVVLYHFIYLPFIAMHRYFFTAMPAVLLLSAAGLVTAWKTLPRKKFVLFILLSGTAPTLCMLLSLLCAPPAQILPKLALAEGPNALALQAALLVAFSVFGWFVWNAFEAANAGDGARAPRLREADDGRAPKLHDASDAPAPKLRFSLLAAMWLTTGAIVSMSAFCTVRHNIASSLPLALPLSEPVVVTMPPVPAGNQYFILLDTFNMAKKPASMDNVQITVNGKLLGTKLLPLFAMDRLQRENFLYERSFAASYGGDVENFRQWWVAPVPNDYLSTTTASHIAIQSADCNEQLYLAADSTVPDEVTYHPSIRQFSWTKGFMFNPWGEIRMNGPSEERATKRELQPRVSIVAVNTSVTAHSDNVAAAASDTPGDYVDARLPDTTIGIEAHRRLFQYTVGQEIIERLAEAKTSAYRVAISGSVRALRKRGEAGVALIETLSDGKGKHTEVAPLAPSVIPAKPAWSKFSFEDIVPIGCADALQSVHRTSDVDTPRSALRPLSHTPAAGATPALHHATRSRLDSLLIVLTGVPWYDALQYARYRPRAPVEFKDLKVQIQTTPTFDSSTDDLKVVKCLPLTTEQGAKLAR